MAKVAVLGLGAMGGRMASNSAEAGHQVTVWNRTGERARTLADKGAMVVATPKLAAAGAEFVIAMLRDDAASSMVWLDREDGALAGMSIGAVAIESSTLTPGWVRELSGQAAAAGAAFLDAPVAGSRPQAEARQLIYFVGGDATALAAATPILMAMGAAVHHVGSAGDGAAVKLAVNALLGIQVAALAELIGALRRAGLDIVKALDAVTATPVCSPAAKAASASMLAGSFAPQFPAVLAEKDLGYALQDAQQRGASLPMTEAARAVFGLALAAGHGDEHLTGIVRLYR